MNDEMRSRKHENTKLAKLTKLTKKRVSVLRFRAFVSFGCFVYFVCFVVASVVVASSPQDVQATDVERGKQTFMRVGCYQCHGREAQGASTGPRLGPNPLPLPAFARAIRTPRNEMPPYSLKLLSDADLADVHAFVAARPRPHPLPR
jgi:mono/diheme cytochrome c family protein